ncbi:amidinotransferase [Sphingomonas sabuli]|uniref:Amidinotransferase n=1 Tax=Sphingomonas sabuli TaxID=2764186 RepID=A0A7G9L3D3_9SPHN|nr:arginine deiminase-related protein [Sphingomonas sabuli]QNM83132.1 amidinotransferase [Sphingomonas sabuli]
MDPQSAGTVLLVRPAAFGFNAEAARSNAFARQSARSDVQKAAAAEFDGLAAALDRAGVTVLVLDDTPDPVRPDAVFPNNWVSFHADGTMAVYPMATAPRRAERRTDDVMTLVRGAGFAVERLVDLSDAEAAGHFLEGTGSLILDRPTRRAFANRSERTDAATVERFDAALGYRTHLFDAFDPDGRAIYHTNVLLSLGTGFAVLCREAVAEADRAKLVEAIEAGGRTIVEMSFAQLQQFGCNLIELRGKGGPVIALSQTALASLRPDQVRQLETYGELVPAAIPTIEAVGGGSVRCMIAEVHLPRG